MQISEIYKILFESSDIAIFIFQVLENHHINKDNKYEYKFIITNPTHQNLTGITLKEIENKKLFELESIIPKEYLNNIKNKYDECVIHKKSIEYEEEILIKGKLTYWLTKLFPVIKQNKVEYIIGMSIDISEKKELIIKLENYNLLLKNLLDNSPVGIAVTDKDYHIIYYNKNFLKIWNLKESDIENDRLVFFKLLKQIKNRKKVYPKIIKLAKLGKKGIIKFLKLEKRLIQMEIYPLIYKSEDGKIENKGILGIYIDRTKDVLQEIKLKKLLKQLELANRAKTEFLANISHELRTPLTTIIGLVELLENQANKNSQKYVKMIYESANYLKNLIEEILDLSSIELKTLKIEKKPFNLNEVMEFLAKTYQMHCNKKNLSFFYKTDIGNLNIVLGDQKRFYQIINNLLSNALKFTPKGKIELRVLKTFEDEKKLSIMIEVEDTGIGIPEEYLPHIFDRFKKFDDFNINPQGVGIGLSLVKEFVQLMEGKIEVESKLNEGTLFRIYFNFEKTGYLLHEKIEDYTAEELIKEYQYLLENKKILIAEDTYEIQLLLKKFLLDTGLKIDIVSNGLEVLEKIKNNHYDMILLDLKMPLLDGINTFLQIEENIKKQIPIAALTAHAMEEDIQKSKELGFADHITKPFTKKELLMRIIKMFLTFKH
jgi:PAS domain S-box-containing protein